MSKIGKQNINIPEKVSVALSGTMLNIEGPLGKKSLNIDTEMFDVNIKGTFNVIQSCVLNNVEKLIYSSSASVYGDAITEPMLENHPFSSQVFLPFNATGFLVLVAPIGNKPKIDLIEIFKVSGGDGINFNPKVWHFPLISLENEKYITIDKKDADNNIEIYNFEQSEIFELNYE